MKVIKVSDLEKAITDLGFKESEDVLIFPQVDEIIIKRIFKGKESLREFATPIWQEAKKLGLTEEGISNIIHEVRKAKTK